MPPRKPEAPASEVLVEVEVKNRAGREYYAFKDAVEILRTEYGGIQQQTGTLYLAVIRKP